MKWDIVRLGDVCELFVDGNWIESKDQSPNGIRLLQVGNVGKGVFIHKNESKKFISTETFMRLNCTEVLPGDILISRLPEPVGRACIVPSLTTRMITAVDCTIARLNLTLCDRLFFMYSLSCDNYFMQVNSFLAGATRQRISRSNLENITISLPPIEEQRRIAAEIERQFAAVEKAKRAAVEQLAAMRALNGAYLRELFEGNDWDIVRLGDVCETMSGGTPTTSNKDFYYNGTIPWLNSGELNQGIVHTAEKFITQAGLDNSSAKIVPMDSVLVAMYGATAGVVGLLNFSSAINQAICAILPNDVFHPYFLYRFLQTQRDKMLSKTAGGAQPNISQEIIKSLSIPLPPLDEQRRIVTEIERKFATVERVKTAGMEQLNTINTIPTAILRQAFNVEM